MENNKIERVPIYLKLALTSKEAAEYSNIGINKIDSMLRAPKCPFVLFVGTKNQLQAGDLSEKRRYAARSFQIHLERKGTL